MCLDSIDWRDSADGRCSRGCGVGVDLANWPKERIQTRLLSESGRRLVNKTVHLLVTVGQVSSPIGNLYGRTTVKAGYTVR